jgi:hypothetical protein
MTTARPRGHPRSRLGRLSTGGGRRHECRRGTHECVRHVECFTPSHGRGSLTICEREAVETGPRPLGSGFRNWAAKIPKTVKRPLSEDLRDSAF